MGSKVAVNGFDSLYAVTDYERYDAERFCLTLPGRFVPAVWTPVGTIEITEHLTVNVSVMAMPARFYRLEVVTEDIASVTLETGSGRFPQYWDMLIQYLNTGVLPETLEVA